MQIAVGKSSKDVILLACRIAPVLAYATPTQGDVMKLSMFSAALLLAGASLFSAASHATVVLVKTNMGDFEINLYDKETPKTVANFLAYVKDNSYNKAIFHRSVPGFVLQGGGFQATMQSSPLTVAIPAKAAVINEPLFSNVRGTIAMAKIDRQPDSATNQWFINLSNNVAGDAALDSQNSGFTVFGQINNQGMEIIDNIAKLPTQLTNIANFPLRNYSDKDAANNVAITPQNLVIIESMTIIDSSDSTSDKLTKVKNTSAGNSGGGSTGTTPEAPKSSGGSLGFFSSVALLGLCLFRRYFRQQ